MGFLLMVFLFFVKVKVVTTIPNFMVRVVSAFQYIKVEKMVVAFPDKNEQWQK